MKVHAQGQVADNPLELTLLARCQTSRLVSVSDIFGFNIVSVTQFTIGCPRGWHSQSPYL